MVCLGPYGGPKGVGISYEQGIPVRVGVCYLVVPKLNFAEHVRHR
jgi:hypothetical protein